MSAVRICAVGCCPGCSDCFGMQLNCHQTPCRCDKPCTCDWSTFDEVVRDGCERHDSTHDSRCDLEPDDPNDFELDEMHISAPCSECGEHGACRYDDQGRQMIHATPRGVDDE